MVQKIRLLHITSSLKVGGAETILGDLLEQLPGDRFEHHVIYFHDGSLRERINALGVPTYHITGFISLYDPVFMLRLWLRIKAINPDGIHSLLWAANVTSRVLGRLLGIPVICAYHNNVDQDGMVRNVIDRLTFAYAGTIIAVSGEVAESIMAMSAHKNRPPITVIPNGIACARIVRWAHEQRVERHTVGLLSEHIVIGSVGRFVSVKNYPLLLKAFAAVYKRHQNARLVLVGQGPDEGALRRLADQLGISAVTVFIVGKKAYGYYGLFDLFVQCSDKEGISMALLEAMCCRVPCIVTNVHKHHPVVTTGINGIVVQASQIAALTDALMALISDAIGRNAYAQSAYTHVVDHFDQKIMVERYRQVFEEYCRR